jgi:hypothetical protein
MTGVSSESQEVTPLGTGGVPGRATVPAPKRGSALLSRVQVTYQAHPLLATWAVLAVGMVIILLWASRDVDLLLQQRLFLVLATIGLAGLCAWIIGWEE